jgi:Secretion system C-terminal sorting domain
MKKMHIHIDMLKKKLLLFSLLLLGLFRVQASHYYGFDLTYECLGPDSFRIWHMGVWDCAAVSNLLPNVVITPLTGSCGAPTIYPWVLASQSSMSPFPPSTITNCVNPGSTINSYLTRKYYRDVKFPTAATCAYNVSFGTCCRSGSSNSMPGSQSYYMQIDTLHVNASSCNSSPQWDGPPVLYIFAGQPHIYDQSATDPDGDSVAYRFTPSLAAAGTSVNYNPGYSPTSPLGATYTFNLDPVTGILEVVPGSAANFQFGYMVVTAEEWRNGVKIGEVNRETILLASPFASLCAGNNAPTWQLQEQRVYSAPSIFTNHGRDIGSDSILLHPNTQLRIRMQGLDADPGQATRIVWLEDLPGGVLSDTFLVPADTVSGISPWAEFRWTPPNVQSGAFRATFALLDTSCNPMSMFLQHMTIVIEDTGHVWPGDANNDLSANFLDLFPIGLAYASTGPPRSLGGQDNLWYGHMAGAWTDTLPGPLDKKYVDCNGNGTINDDDTLAITLNYGLVHTKGRIAARGSGADPALVFDVLQDSAEVGDTVTAAIYLGDAFLPANNVYGIGFQIAYDPAAIDSSTFQLVFQPSWLGDASNTLSIVHNDPLLALCDGAQVRKTHTAVSGMGQIATATFIIIDNIDGKRAQLDSLLGRFFFTQAYLIGLDGSPLPINPLGDSLMVYQLSVERPGPSLVDAPTLYPVPSSGLVQVKAPGHELATLEVLDLSGRLLARYDGQGLDRLRLDLGDLPSGTYFLNIHSNMGRFTRRLVLQN